jgi:transglutaminase-like putative cysteine protease
MLKRCIGPLGLMLGLPVVLAAQVPRITSSGDPSVRSDSIYALAVDPSAYAGEDVVLLFNDCILSVNPDGTARRTYRTVAQVLTPEGAKNYGQWNLTYHPERERLQLNWVRVLKVGGKEINRKPEVDQESPEAIDGQNVYSGQLMRQLTLGGVAPGTIVDVSYTLERVHPALAGDAFELFLVSQFVPVRRSRFILDAPRRQPAHYQTFHLDDAPAVRVSGNRVVTTWTAADIPAIRLEEYADNVVPVYQAIRVWGWEGWRDVGDWFAGLSEPRAQATPDVVAASKRAFQGETGVEDRLRAVQRWIAQDFRYVSIGLGQGGYQPRTPADVVSSQFGDCKDKALLMVAVARQLGAAAWVVLVNSRGLGDTTPVSLERFNHAIALIELKGTRTYLDLTDELLPYGELSTSLEGSMGLVIRPNGGSEWVRLPESPLGHNWYEVTVRGDVNPGGDFGGTLTVGAAGTAGRMVREILNGVTTGGNDALLDAAGGLRDYYLPDAVVDSTRIRDGRDLANDAWARVSVHQEHFLERVGDRFLLRLPPPFIDAREKLERLGDRPRRFPIDAVQVNDASTARFVLELTLPPGWRAELPDSLEVNGLFGRYQTSAIQRGRTLRVVRDLAGRRGIEPADSVESLRRWLRALDNDRTRSVVLVPGPAAAAPDTGFFTAPTADTTSVLLSFSWPDGFSLSETSTRLVVAQEGTAVPDSEQTRVDQTFTAHEHAEGLRLDIAFDDIEGSNDTTVMATLERVVQKGMVKQFHPALIVSPSGQLLRLEGFGVMREILDSVLRPVFDTMSDGNEARKALLERLMSEDYLLQQQGEEWNPLVSAWNTLRMAPGAVYQYEEERTLPLLPQYRVRFLTESSMVARQPCEAGAADSACVLLLMRVRPDPAAMSRLTEDLGGADEGVGRGWQVNMVSTFRLLTDPTTMIPRRLESRQDVMALPPPGDSGKAVHNLTVVTRQYRPVVKPGPMVDARRLEPGTDSFTVYRLAGTDTTAIGYAVDRLERRGAELTRVYLQRDSMVGHYVDTLRADGRALGTIEHSVRTPGRRSRLQATADSLQGWIAKGDGDSTTFRFVRRPGSYNGSLLDLVLRSHDWNSRPEISVKVFEAPGVYRMVQARLLRTETVQGRRCWVIEGWYGSLPMTYWIDQRTRRPVRHFVELPGGDGLLLTVNRKP